MMMLGEVAGVGSDVMTEQRYDGSDRGGGVGPPQAITGPVAPPVSPGTRVREAMAQT